MLPPKVSPFLGCSLEERGVWYFCPPPPNKKNNSKFGGFPGNRGGLQAHGPPGELDESSGARRLPRFSSGGAKGADGPGTGDPAEGGEPRPGAAGEGDGHGGPSGGWEGGVVSLLIGGFGGKNRTRAEKGY